MRCSRPDGFTGGLGLGFNWQYGQLVYGVETDIQLSGADDTVASTDDAEATAPDRSRSRPAHDRYLPTKSGAEAGENSMRVMMARSPIAAALVMVGAHVPSRAFVVVFDAP